MERRLAALRAEKEAREEEEYFKEHPDEKEIAGLNSAIDRFVTGCAYSNFKLERIFLTSNFYQSAF